jgi:hypothetical protein
VSKPRLTVARVERELRSAIEAGDVYIRQQPLKGSVAQVDIANKPHRILLDPLRGALLDSLVHEVIHVVFLDRLLPWGALEEPIVEAIEEQVVRYINRSKTRVAWWRRVIDEALEQDS